MPKITNTAANRQKAIEALGINVPVYRTRIVGGRMELHCYGGLVVKWPAKTSRTKPRTSKAKPRTSKAKPRTSKAKPDTSPDEKETSS